MTQEALTERMRAFGDYLETVKSRELTDEERAALLLLYVDLIACLKGPS